MNLFTHLLFVSKITLLIWSPHLSFLDYLVKISPPSTELEFTYLAAALTIILLHCAFLVHPPTNPPPAFYQIFCHPRTLCRCLLPSQDSQGQTTPSVHSFLTSSSQTSKRVPYSHTHLSINLHSSFISPLSVLDCCSPFLPGSTRD